MSNTATSKPSGVKDHQGGEDHRRYLGGSAADVDPDRKTEGWQTGC